MEGLAEETWDLVIAGTGLQQSLLALSLSRSNLKTLHVDQNSYYGGEDAGLSLDEAEKWAERQNSAGPRSTPVSLYRASESTDLAASRAYTLSLRPQIIYAASSFLPSIVTSQLYNQLDFLAVGPLWMLREGRLKRIPSSREDVFADDELSRKDKIGLMKFLRYVLRDDTDSSEETEMDVGHDTTLSEALTSRFKIADTLHAPIAALALSRLSTSRTSFGEAVARIQRHMKSLNHFGPGFAAVYPKYAGNAEIAQAACRVGAVGGATYVLGPGIVSVDRVSEMHDMVAVELGDRTTVKTKRLVGRSIDLPAPEESSTPKNSVHVAKQMNLTVVVATSLKALFPQTAENGPIPAVAIVYVEDKKRSGEAPIYLQIHSEDTGECPIGQCCIYASTIIQSDTSDTTDECLHSAVYSLLQALGVSEEMAADNDQSDQKHILWSMSYVTTGASPEASVGEPFEESQDGHVLKFSPTTLDIAFDDRMLKSVKAVWRKIIGPEGDDDRFLIFEDRNASNDS